MPSHVPTNTPTHSPSIKVGGSSVKNPDEASIPTDQPTTEFGRRSLLYAQDASRVQQLLSTRELLPLPEAENARRPWSDHREEHEQTQSLLFA